ncbi:hypothetical protein [Nocardia sp. NPDC051570]|uniref:hypothetical protein n=1 Tax=Nocardia sp. NPDC051570 TaxID=3364324 RepID=UPI0037887499
MTTMRGVCEHTGGRNFTVNTINRSNEAQQVFDGKFVDDIPPFTVLGARIEAPYLDALRGAHRFSGTVGPARLSLVFDSQARISGSIVPALDREWSIKGEGYWRTVF